MLTITNRYVFRAQPNSKVYTVLQMSVKYIYGTRWTHSKEYWLKCELVDNICFLYYQEVNCIQPVSFPGESRDTRQTSANTWSAEMCLDTKGECPCNRNTIYITFWLLIYRLLIYYIFRWEWKTMVVGHQRSPSILSRWEWMWISTLQSGRRDLTYSSAEKHIFLSDRGMLS